MGVAMLAGWLEGGLDPKQIVVQDPSPPPRGKELLREAWHRRTSKRRLAPRAAGSYRGGGQAAGDG